MHGGDGVVLHARFQKRQLDRIVVCRLYFLRRAHGLGPAVPQHAVPWIVPIGPHQELPAGLIPGHTAGDAAGLVDAGLHLHSVAAVHGRVVADIQQNVTTLQTCPGGQVNACCYILKAESEENAPHIAGVGCAVCFYRHTGQLPGGDHRAGTVIVRPPAVSLVVTVRQVISPCLHLRNRFFNHSAQPLQ